MMPALAVTQLAPRIVGVEFPFGHSFGMPGDRRTQRRVLEAAVTVLSGASAFGTRIDLDLEWPQPRGEAYRGWQPRDASPMVATILKEPQRLESRS